MSALLAMAWACESTQTGTYSTFIEGSPKLKFEKNLSDGSPSSSPSCFANQAFGPPLMAASSFKNCWKTLPLPLKKGQKMPRVPPTNIKTLQKPKIEEENPLGTEIERREKKNTKQKKEEKEEGKRKKRRTKKGKWRKEPYSEWREDWRRQHVCKNFHTRIVGELKWNLLSSLSKANKIKWGFQGLMPFIYISKCLFEFLKLNQMNEHNLLKPTVITLEIKRRKEIKIMIIVRN